MSHLPIAVQMFTLREAAAQDLRGVLQRIAGLGYDGVELAGTFGLAVAELAETFAELNLRCISAHVPLAALRADLEHQLETYQALGASYIVCPWLPPEERANEAGYLALAAELNQIGQRCRAHGLQLCYHHHDFELVRFNGKYALDILLDNSDPRNLQLEADTYWLKVGGADPVTYIQQRIGRIPLLHLKDVSNTEPPTFTEVGHGRLDWPAIFNVAETGNVQWYLVEQDTCPGDPFNSIKISLENLRRMTARSRRFS